jgi:hypothetical protein
MARLCSITVAFLLTYAAVGCGGNQPAGKPPAGDNKDQKTPPKAAERKPDFNLTAEELTREIQKDKDAANKKYLGKLLELTGDVSSVASQEGGKEASVQMEGAKRDPKDVLGMLVLVRLQPKYAQTALQLSTKQKIKVTGEYGGATSLAAVLDNGAVQELGISEVISVTAPELTAEFLKDPKAAAKYAKKELIVSGDVDDVTKERGFTFAKLKGDGKARVSVTIGAMDADLLRKGQKVRLRCGSLGDVPFDNNEVRLDMGMIVEAK